MTITEAKKLKAGDEFITHIPNRDRRAYRVTERTVDGITVVDQYGYLAFVQFAPKENRPFFTNAFNVVIA